MFHHSYKKRLTFFLYFQISNNSKAIMKFIFNVVIFVFWITQTTANDDYIFLKYPNQTNLHFCQDDMISLNFTNARISDIGPYFISSPLIACLNLSNNHIRFVANDAFKNLPNLTYLILSKNNLQRSNFFNFGGHEKLKILNLNDAFEQRYGEQLEILFEDCPNLEFLYARNNRFTNLKYSLSDTFNAYHYASYYSSQKILFPKLKVLDLSENNIESTNFVSLLSNTLQFLDLHKNNLKSMNLKEKGENLFILDLDNNKFKIVEYTQSYNDASLTLTYLHNLRYLSVSENKINIIYSTAFQDTKKLSYLNLSRNEIHEVHADTFANLYSLSTLDLSFNLLQNIPQVSNNINISNLFLNVNKIQKIISNAFAQTSKLTKLSLENNKIDEINAEAFADLSVLKILDLSHNKLNYLPEGWTKSLVSLKYLDLSSNMFTSLESLSLASAMPLIELYLVSNSLEYLNVQYFECLPQNLTVNLIQSFNFTQISLKYKYYEDNKYNTDNDYDIEFQ